MTKIEYGNPFVFECSEFSENSIVSVVKAFVKLYTRKPKSRSSFYLRTGILHLRQTNLKQLYK